MEEKSNRKYYDEAFTEIFSNRKMIESRLKDIVAEPWVDFIDFDKLTISKSTFKGIAENKKESDLLIRFPLKNHPLENFYLFIMMEFQSSPSKMIIRILEYLTKAYKKQIKEQKRLFPIIPLVIYNGKANWTEDPDLRNHFIDLPQGIERYIPLYSYILIDISHYSEDYLFQIKSAVSFFFLLDKTNINHTNRASYRILGLFKELQTTDPEIFTLLSRYIEKLMNYKGLKIKSISDYLNNRGETMLAQSIDELKEKGIQEGILKGKLEGKLEGLEEGLLKGKLEGIQLTAKKMIDEGLSFDMISHITDLSISEINDLSKKE